MTDLLSALGLVLVIEGALYALAPAIVKNLAVVAIETSEGRLRVGGIVAAAIGVGVVWIVRG